MSVTPLLKPKPNCTKNQSTPVVLDSTVKIRRRKRCKFLLPKIFLLFWRKIPQILKSGITHMDTSNGGHPLHHHLRHSDRLSNSLFNRRTTKSQNFTQWLQASTLQFTSQWTYRPFIITPADRVQSDLTLYVLGLGPGPASTKKNNGFVLAPFLFDKSSVFGW